MNLEDLKHLPTCSIGKARVVEVAEVSVAPRAWRSEYIDGEMSRTHHIAVNGDFRKQKFLAYICGVSNVDTPGEGPDEHKLIYAMMVCPESGRPDAVYATSLEKITGYTPFKLPFSFLGASA